MRGDMHRDELGRFVRSKGILPAHGPARYRLGCRCLTCRREENLRVRAYYEKACDTCAGPTWGVRCAECRRLERRVRSVQPRGLHYQWGCP